jgi:hypothetical protein
MEAVARANLRGVFDAAHGVIMNMDLMGMGFINRSFMDGSLMDGSFMKGSFMNRSLKWRSFHLHSRRGRVGDGRSLGDR